jgi:hypothetical protein
MAGFAEVSFKVCRGRETIETVLSFTAQIHPAEAGC